MPVTDSPLKAYTTYGSDPAKTFQNRRFLIHQRLPALSGYELQKTIESIDEDLAKLKGEVAECEGAIRQVKQGADPEEVRRKFNITWSLSTRTEEIIEQFKQVIAERKSTAKWIRREKAIYLREKYLRKLAAAQLPFARLKLKDLDKQTHDVLGKVRAHLEEVDQLCSTYEGIPCEIWQLQTKVHKLSFTRENLNSPPTIQPNMIDANRKFLETLRNNA